MSSPASLLAATGVSAAYGRVKALRGVDVEVAEGEAVCLIGANGAGKTTLMRTLAGLHPPAAGRVELNGQDVTGWPAERMVAHGLSLVPEGRQVFGGLPVIDNLRLGAYRSRAAKAGVNDDLAQVLELFPVLADRRDQLAGTLSGGEQQMLVIGRGLMSHPRVLLLDEPSLGLAPMAVAEVVHRLVDLVERGVTILLVEQNARAALRVCSRGYVIASGEVVAGGPTDALLDDPAVRAAYLGAAADASTQTRVGRAGTQDDEGTARTT